MIALKSSLHNFKNYVFGSTSAIITNTSLIVGLGSGHVGKLPILGGLLTIALADNISDSLSIHMYKEAEGADAKDSFISTIIYFSTRLGISASFILILLLFPMEQVGNISIIWGLALITVISYFIAQNGSESPAQEIIKHVLVAVLVVAASRYVGYLISRHI